VLRHDCARFTFLRSLPLQHFSVCFVGAGHKGATQNRLTHQSNLPHAETVELLLRFELLRAHDVLVANSGLTSFGHNMTGQLLPLATLLQRLQASGTARVLWRETSPQHFPPPRKYHMSDGSTGDFFVYGAGVDGGGMYHKQLKQDYKEHGRCEPSTHPLRHTALAKRDLDLMASLHIPIVRIWALSSSQFDAHRALYTSFAHRNGALDCTHFCFPSGVLEAWTDALLNSLAWYPP